MKQLKFYSSRIMFAAYAALVAAHRLLSLMVPLCTQKLIDAIPQGSMESLRFYGLANLVIVILFILCLSAANFVQECYENGKILLEKKEFAERINKIPYEKFFGNSSGYYLQRFNSDIEKCRPFIINKRVQFWVQGVYLLSIAFLMLRIDVTYALLLFSVFPLMMIFYKKLAHKVGAVSRKVESTQDEMNSYFEEMLYCNYALRTTSSSDWYLSRMDGIMQNNFLFRKQTTSVETLYDFVLITGLLNLLSVAVYYFGGVLVLNRHITMGMVVSMSLYYSKLWSPLEFYLDYPKGKAKYEIYRKRIREVYDQSEKTAGKAPQAISLSKMEKIDIHSLSYAIDQKVILDDFSLSICRGDKIGIMGGNGSGKTTLANIICGLLKNYEGEITYNGIDYRDIDKEELVRHICLIPAAPQLFAGTVEEKTLRLAVLSLFQAACWMSCKNRI